MTKKIAIYPGSFDPFHEGHLNILKKANPLFKKIYIVVTNNINKNEQNDINIRIQKTKEFLKNNHIKMSKKIIIIKNDKKLTAELAKDLHANYLIRGIRNETDFKYEQEMSNANKIINKNLQTIYFFNEDENLNISSSIIKEIEFYKNK